MHLSHTRHLHQTACEGICKYAAAQNWLLRYDMSHRVLYILKCSEWWIHQAKGPLEIYDVDEVSVSFTHISQTVVLTSRVLCVAVVVHQESVCVTLGSGLSSACVVDVGDQKTSVCCVEDGVSHRSSRSCAHTHCCGCGDDCVLQNRSVAVTPSAYIF